MAAGVGLLTKALLPARVILVALFAMPIVIGGAPAPSWPPATLRDTGLYSDWATKTIARDNLPFSPQYPLWSDGAKKSRWVRIPKGTFIDGSNPDVWRFPVGTRLWKEFRFARRAETRFIERTRAGWQFASYRVERRRDRGPGRAGAGHRGARRFATASITRSRRAPTAAPVMKPGPCTCWASRPCRCRPIAIRTRCTPSHRTLLARPHEPRRARDRARPAARASPARRRESRLPTPTARAALGYLNTNCGNCHTGAGELASLSFALNYTITGRMVSRRPRSDGGGEAEPLQGPADPRHVERVCAGHPEKSVVVARMASRYPLLQMPPLGSQLVDEEAVALIKRWISEDIVSAGAVAADRGDKR